MYRACSTTLFGLVLVPALAAQARDAHKATVAFARSLQARDGGFLAAPGQPRSSLRATTSALRALKYFGGTPADPRGCAAFVKRCFDADSGGFADSPGGKPDVFSTAVGVMAVEELKLSAAPYEAGVLAYLGENARSFEEIRIAAAALESLGKRPPQAETWLAQVAKLNPEDGPTGRETGPRDTGRVVVAVLRLGGTPSDAEAVLTRMKAGQRADGGFGKEGAKGSDLETCYRVMRAFHMLKAKPDAKKLRGFIAACRNADGGYGVAPASRRRPRPPITPPSSCTGSNEP